jgi:hypothetical protein
MTPPPNRIKPPIANQKGNSRPNYQKKKKELRLGGFEPQLVPRLEGLYLNTINPSPRYYSQELFGLHFDSSIDG